MSWGWGGGVGLQASRWAEYGKMESLPGNPLNHRTPLCRLQEGLLCFKKSLISPNFKITINMTCILKG